MTQRGHGLFERSVSTSLRQPATNVRSLQLGAPQTALRARLPRPIEMYENACRLLDSSAGGVDAGMVAARRTVRVESVQAEKSRRERRPSGVEMNALAEKALRRSGVHIVVDVLPQMKAALGELQGEAAAAALFHLSKEGMKAWCTKMGEELGLPGSPASIRLLEQVDARNHWGRSRLLNVGPPPAPREVIAEGRLEPDFVSLLDGAASRFMRGLVAGLQALSSALRRTQAERSRRAAEEAYCRFEEKWQL